MAEQLVPLKKRGWVGSQAVAPMLVSAVLALWDDLTQRVAIAKTANAKRDALRRWKPHWR